VVEDFDAGGAGGAGRVRLSPECGTMAFRMLGVLAAGVTRRFRELEWRNTLRYFANALKFKWSGLDNSVGTGPVGGRTALPLWSRS